jgi:hypothetical protein
MLHQQRKAHKKNDKLDALILSFINGCAAYLLAWCHPFSRFWHMEAEAISKARFGRKLRTEADLPLVHA